MRRHFVIPDTQVKPGVPTDHLAWIAQAILEYKPNVVVHLGDHWDMPSLSRHDPAGSQPMEGARYENDIAVGNDAWEKMFRPMFERDEHLKKNKMRRWLQEAHWLKGNHEERVDRALYVEPKYSGMIGEHHMLTPGFTRHAYLKVHVVDGVSYSHFFQNPHSHYAIGGSSDNRLNKIGVTHVQGHVQGWLYGSRQFPTGARRHCLVVGSCYLHDEAYRGRQGNGEWRGVVVLNEVRDGDFCIMPLTLDYLCRKYEGMSVSTYLRKKYEHAEQLYTLARGPA